MVALTWGNTLTGDDAALSSDQMRAWFRKTGLTLEHYVELLPGGGGAADTGDRLTVTIWVARRPLAAESATADAQTKVLETIT